MIRRLGMVAAVGLVLAAGQSVPHAAAAPSHKWMSYPGGIVPGASIAQVRDDHRQLQRCTVGFIGQKGSQRYLITAGHCNELPNTGYSSSVIYTDATTPKGHVSRASTSHRATGTESPAEPGSPCPPTLLSSSWILVRRSLLR